METKVKLLILVMCLLLTLSLALVGCSTGISQEEYDAVVAERDAANTNLAEVQADLQAAQAQIVSLQGNITALQAEIATLKLPDFLAILSAVPAIQAWSAAPTNTTLLAAVTTAANKSEDAGLIQKWQAFLSASAAGTVKFELFQFYGYILGEASQVSPAFPASVRPLMEVGDDMDALVQALDLSMLGKTTAAITASGNQELINRWNQIMGTFGTSLPQAMQMMADMQVWMMGQIAAAAPAS